MALSAIYVHENLRQAAEKLRWSRAAKYGVSGTAVALFFLVVFLGLDALFHLGAAGRWIGFALVLGPWLAGLAAGVRAALPVASEASVARRIEEACDGSGNVLINAVMFDRALEGRVKLREALFAEMRDPFPQVDWAKVFDVRLLKRLALALGAVGLVLFAWAAIRPALFANSAARILLPASRIAPLTRTQIAEVSPGETRVVHGRDLEVRAEISGEIPETVWIEFRVAGESWQRHPMGREVGTRRFSFARKGVKQPLAYRVEAGDATSATYQVGVRARTVVASKIAVVTPPAYARMEPRSVRDFNVLPQVLPGSRVEFSLAFNNPVAEVAVADERGARLEARRGADGAWAFGATVAAAQAFRAEYRDDDYVRDTELLPVAVRVDEPPRITVAEPPDGAALVATPAETAKIRFEVTDDFGLASVGLFRATPEGPAGEMIREWKGEGGRKAFADVAEIPLAGYAKEERVTFHVVAFDANDVTGPGRTVSRPVTVTLKAPAQVQQQQQAGAEKVRAGFDDLVRLQERNLSETQSIARMRPPQGIPAALDRQVQIEALARQLAGSAATLSAEVRATLRDLGARELPGAVVALRNAAGAREIAQVQALMGAIQLQTLILAKLRGGGAALANDQAKTEIRNAIAGIEDLLRRQKAIYGETKAARPESASGLADQQDALAQQATGVGADLAKNATNPAAGDPEFRQRLAQAAAMFKELRVYENMLVAAEALDGKNFPAAQKSEQQVITDLSRIIDGINRWQIAAAMKEADKLHEAAKAMAVKLEKLQAIQQKIVEKSKELARKNEANAADLAAAEELRDLKDLLQEAIEQMLKDAHIYPDLTPANELRNILTEIWEDVEQTDKEAVRKGELEATEIAVEKDEALLDGLRAATELAKDMEHWLPNKNEMEQWNLENFDKTEFPQIPNLPLPDQFTDLVGDLLEQQEELAEKAQDASSNQLFATLPAGWDVKDGPWNAFGAQGKSGNERPNHNEQSGRSSGGREGMSSGEMAGDISQTLEGDKADVRRTNDPTQQGQIQDDGKIGETRATGGGKAGGFSDRAGMEGNAPVRGVSAKARLAANAAAVEQALLADKTAKTYAQASLLYLKADGLPDIARSMEASRRALEAGRIEEFQGLHRKIVARLNEVKSGVAGQPTVALESAESGARAEREAFAGDEGAAPAPYREAVADYFRALHDAP